jgi:2-methylisocitrate lyase-like PEP mutase family enzyme
MTSKGKQLKELIHAPKILITPGVYDGFSARLVQKMGFQSGTISGAGVSESKLGWADRGIMGYGENVEACRRIAACSDLLLQGDADTGYGNSLNVYFTVRGFEDAGLAAVMIEDQVWPKRCGHMAGKAVIPAEEMVQKIKAAVAARRDPDFVIKARTDAVAPLADCLFADALLSAKDIERVAKNVPKPLSVNMGLGIRSRPTTPLLSPRQLEEMGVAQISYPRLLSTAAVKGMMNALQVFTQEVVEKNNVVDRPDLLVSFNELNELMGLNDLEELEKQFAA